MTKDIDQQQNDFNYILNDYKETANQVRIWHALTIVAVCFGALIFFSSLILLIIGLSTKGVPLTSITNIAHAATALLGAIVTAISKLFLDTARSFEKQRDKLRDILNKAEERKRAYQYVDTLKDEALRENLKLEVTRKVLGLSTQARTGSAPPSDATTSRSYHEGYRGNEESSKGLRPAVQAQIDSAPSSDATTNKSGRHKQNRRDANPPEIIEPQIQRES